MSKPFLLSSLLVLGTLSLVACTGSVVPIGEIDKDRSPLDGTGPGPAASGLPACETPTGPVHAYSSIADTEARVAGTWLLCSGRIGSPGDTAGIELLAGNARFLVKEGDALVPKADAAYERKVSFIDTTGMNGAGSYQINLESAAGGTNMYFSRVSEDGKFLELNEGTSGLQGRYVRVAAAPKPCAITGAAHAYTSIADVTGRIAGKWEICAGGITGPADARGLELTAAQAYYLIQAGGALSRGAGWDYERTVQVLDVTGMNGPGSYQINLSTGAGTNMYFSRISETGDVLELDEGTSGKKVTYRRVP